MAIQRFRMVVGTTLNGRITDKNGSFKAFSCQEDKEFLKKMIIQSDVIIVGRKTYDQYGQRDSLKKPHIVFTRQITGTRGHNVKPVHFFNDQAQDLLDFCDLMQYKTITVLGGSEIYHWFLEKKLLTDIYLTLEPHLYGQGLNLLTGSAFIEQNKWKLKKSEQLNSSGTLLLHYQK